MHCFWFYLNFLRYSALFSLYTACNIKTLRAVCKVYFLSFWLKSYRFLKNPECIMKQHLNIYMPLACAFLFFSEMYNLAFLLF